MEIPPDMEANDFDRSRPMRRSTMAPAAIALMVTVSIAVAHASWQEGATSPAGMRPHMLDYKTSPVYFEQNRGQTDEQVRFLSRSPGYTIFLTRQGSVLALHKPTVSAAGKGGVRGRPQPVFTTASVWMNLAGARPDLKIEGIDPQPGRVNYFIGKDPGKWRTDIPTYSRVRYRRVYPGIDLVYYGSAQALEYDLIVAPGADPGAIGIELRDADSIRLNKAGDVVIGTAAGNLTMRKPRIYQLTRAGARTELGGRYVLRSKSRVGFEVAAYDRKRPLVIDPVLFLGYSTYLGGSGTAGFGDQGQGIAVDSSGSAYVTGFAYSSNFPTKNPFQGRNKGSAVGATNAFVTKFSAAGNSLVYSTYLGGSGDPSGFGDQGNGIAVDRSGNAWVTGFTYSSDFPTKNPFQGKNNAFASSGGNAFVTKLSPTGNLLIYSTYLGGCCVDYGSGIAVDTSGNAYISGATSSSDFPLLKPFQSTNFAFPSYNAFVSKFSAVGSLVYSTYLGGSGANGDYGSGIAVDAGGSAYVSGLTLSSDFPVKNAFQGSLGPTNGNGNAFVTKFSTDGSSLVYSTYLGGTTSDSGSAIAVDKSGSAYVTGYTYSSDFPRKNPLQGTNKGLPRNNAFVTKFSTDGSSLVYSTYLGGSGTSKAPTGDYGQGIAVDSSGSAYVTGATHSSDFPTKNPFQGTNKAFPATNAFVTKFSTDGRSLVYSTYLGGSGKGASSYSDYGQGIAVDSRGNAYVTGGTHSANFPMKSPFQAANKAFPAGNAFVTKLSFGTPPTPTPTRKPTPTPTKKATRTPTKTPTRTATRKPTRSPTKKPTRTPTRKPTRTPTKKPTPTAKPTPPPPRAAGTKQS